MEPLTLGSRKGKMYRGVVSKLWGNGVAAVVAMSIVDDVTCQVQRLRKDSHCLRRFRPRRSKSLELETRGNRGPGCNRVGSVDQEILLEARCCKIDTHTTHKNDQQVQHPYNREHLGYQ